MVSTGGQGPGHFAIRYYPIVIAKAYSVVPAVTVSLQSKSDPHTWCFSESFSPAVATHLGPKVASILSWSVISCAVLNLPETCWFTTSEEGCNMSCKLFKSVLCKGLIIAGHQTIVSLTSVNLFIQLKISLTFAWMQWVLGQCDNECSDNRCLSHVCVCTFGHIIIAKDMITSFCDFRLATSFPGLCTATVTPDIGNRQHKNRPRVH